MKAQKKAKKRRQRENAARRIVEVRTLRRGETAQFDALMKQKHYLGAAKPIGDFLRQVAVVDDEWVALLVWGPPCYSLHDRDEWIGWSPTLCAERQKLIAQNRRFLFLPEKGSRPNLASQVLAASVRALPAAWEERFGYRPVLAETFTDFEQGYEGISYRASGWEPIGFSKGFKRHRADFYQPGQTPKKLWVKKLQPNAVEVLCAPSLPAAQAAGGASSAHGVMPFTSPQRTSLSVALQNVPDPRARASRFRLGGILSITAMAVLSGHNNVAAIQRFAGRLTQKQRKELRMPLKPGTKFREIPSYKIFYSVLSNVDLDELSKALNTWLHANSGSLPAALAVDGKFIREDGGVLSFANHDTGVPERMAPVKQKEKGKRNELRAAQTAIKDGPPLNGKILSFDALHCQDDTGRAVVEKDGDYLIQVKGNRKILKAETQRALEDAPPLSTAPTPDMDAS